jgi:hypothetical protein
VSPPGVDNLSAVFPLPTFARLQRDGTARRSTGYDVLIVDAAFKQSRAGETSVPGLYFAGAPTVLSIGPSARFIAGTDTLSALLAKTLARRARAAR